MLRREHHLRGELNLAGTVLFLISLNPLNSSILHGTSSRGLPFLPFSSFLLEIHFLAHLRTALIEAPVPKFTNHGEYLSSRDPIDSILKY